MKITGIIMMLVMGILLVFGFACDAGSSEEGSSPVTPDVTTKTTVTQPTAMATTTPLKTTVPATVSSPIPTVTPSLKPTPIVTSKPLPSPTPTEPAVCEEDRQAIKAALDAYYIANGQWPTANGEPGLIVWNKIVPDLLDKIPSTNSCKWQVNSDPLGEVCRSANC